MSDADIKKIMAAGQNAGPSTPVRASGEGRRPEVWERTLSGIISDFRGELSELDTATSLDLRDPTTPARRQALLALRARSDGVTKTEDTSSRPTLKSASSSPARMPTPTFNLQPAEASMSSDHAATPPRRTSSFQNTTTAAIRARSGSASTGPPPRMSSLKYGPRSPQLRSGSGSLASTSAGVGMDRLRAQHRSTASTSEPSLIPVSDIGGEYATRFTVNNRGSAGVRGSSVKGSMEDGPDLDARGKELAQRCWNEDEDFLAKDKIAEWLGGQSVINKVALRHYIDHFEFSGLRLDLAFR